MALIVLCTHSQMSWATDGFLAVTTFFVLSGYLITVLLLKEYESTGRISLSEFYSRRARRLMPASLIGLLAVAALAPLLARPDRLESLLGDVVAALAYVANWRFIVTGQTYAAIFESPSPVQHFWTLSIEEQFYLMLPLITSVALVSRWGSRKLMAGLLATGAIASTLWMAWLHVEGNPFSRMYLWLDSSAPRVNSPARLDRSPMREETEFTSPCQRRDGWRSGWVRSCETSQSQYGRRVFSTLNAESTPEVNALADGDHRRARASRFFT